MTVVFGSNRADPTHPAAPLPAAPGPALEEPLSRADFRLLQALVDHGAMPAAAKAAGLTQSAAGRQIARMERRCGIALIVSEHEDIRLTEAGWALLSAGRRLLGALEGVLGSLGGGPTRQLPSTLPTLRMAAFGTDWAELADDLARRVPGMLLNILAAEPGQGRELFDRHRADVAYVWQAPGSRYRLDRPATLDLVADEPLGVALPVNHRCADQSVVRLADLAEDRWLVGASVEARELLSAACRGIIEPRVGFTVESAAQLRGLLGHGRGVALASALTRLPRENRGFVIRPLAEAPRRRLLLITDPAVAGRGLAAVLLSCLRRSYVERAGRRNPTYLNSADFPVDVADIATAAAVDGELLSRLAVLPGLPDGTRPVTLEPEDLHLLRVVAEYGSLNRAAPILSITQPALTRRIGRLEERLSVRLLLRGHRGTVLTPTGRRLLAGVSDAESGLHSVLSGFQDSRRKPGLAV